MSKKEEKLWNGIKTEDSLWRVEEYHTQGRRPTMEDTSIVIKNFGGSKLHLFCAIFDGHFGDRCAKFLHKNLANVILSNGLLYTDTVKSLEQAYFDVDEQWIKEATKDENNKMEDGSTALTCIIMNRTLVVANTGDSRVIMCQGGVAKALSVDHKPNSQKERERIEKAGGHIINQRIEGRLAISRAFGDIEFKTGQKKWVTCMPDVEIISITPDIDFIVLGCDGVYDELSNEDIVAFVSHRINLKLDLFDITKELAEEAIEMGSTDNISIIIIQFHKKFQKLVEKSFQLQSKEVSTTNKNSEGLRRSGNAHWCMLFLVFLLSI
eukprot:TRINITY_DN1792_c0_g1_i15.p1 TRINITY_DN1792_c0_g1~~TRINITY_DN1792_c0_g1_i15.p1  ORF type:complete len:323 (-),score=60.32 TRINITY_DN1792_c0_g1_i15:1459-2427(-)